MPTVIYDPATLYSVGGTPVSLQAATPGVQEVGNFHINGTGIVGTLIDDSLTSGRVVLAGTAGLLQDDAGLLYAGTGTSLSLTLGTDVTLTRRGTGNINLGAADAAAPVSQALSVQGVAAGTADTAGTPFYIEGSRSTGTGAGGAIIHETTYPSTTGNTQNALSMRSFVGSGWTTLTESAATSIATVTFGASSAVSAEFLVTIEANDGTDYQCLTSRVRVSSVRKAAGNTVSTVGLIGSDVLAESTGTSTLTCTFTVTEGASAVTLKANAVSSLTQTVLRATFQAIANGPNVAIAQV